MPDNAVLTQSATREAICDQDIDWNISYRKGGNFRTLENAYLLSLRLCSGNQPSVARIETTSLSREDTIPCFLGTKDDVLIGTRIAIWIEGALALNGNVVTRHESITEDGYAFDVYDDRWLLEGVQMLGSYVFCITSKNEDGSLMTATDAAEANIQYPEGTLYLKTNHPSIFNYQGQPNCIDTRFGPVFAPYEWYGVDPGNPRLNPCYDTRFEARFWRIVDVLDYLRFVYNCLRIPNQSSIVGRQTAKGCSGGEVIAKDLIWSEGVSKSIISDDELRSGEGADLIRDGSKNLGGGARVINLRFGEGYTYNVLAALNTVCSLAGNFGIYCSPVSEGVSELKIVPMQWLAMGESKTVNQQDVLLQRSSKQWPKLIHAAGIMDGRNTYSKTVVAGDSIFVESRVTHKPIGGGASTLLPAWTTSEENAWREFIKDQMEGAGVLGKTLAYQAACSKYPKVFCAYKISDEFDYLVGTKYAGNNGVRLPLHPRVLAHLLTYVKEYGAYTELGLGAQLRRVPLTCQVESYYSTDNPEDWHVETTLDGMSLSNDGTIFFPGLRDLSISNSGKSGEQGTFNGGNFTSKAAVDNIKARSIRLTLAIESDMRLIRSVSTGQMGMAAAGNGVIMPNGANILNMIQLNGTSNDNSTSGRYAYEVYKSAETGLTSITIYNEGSTTPLANAIIVGQSLDPNKNQIVPLLPVNNSGVSGFGSINLSAITGLPAGSSNGGGIALLSSATGADDKVEDPNGEAKWFDNDGRRILVVDAYAEYKEYLRKDSYPYPEKSVLDADPEAAYKELLPPLGRVDRCLDEQELLTEKSLCLLHAQKRHRAASKLMRSASLSWDGFCLWDPGTKLTNIRVVKPDGTSVLREIHSTLYVLEWNRETQRTEMHFV